MDAIRAQIREVADTPIGIAVKDLTDKIDAKVASIQASAHAIDTPPLVEGGTTMAGTGNTKQRSATWPWSIIL